MPQAGCRVPSAPSARARHPVTGGANPESEQQRVSHPGRRLQFMRTTFDAEVDAAYISLAPETAPGRSVRNVEVESAGGSVVLDFDAEGVLLGVEVLGATRILDREFLDAAERIDQ